MCAQSELDLREKSSNEPQGDDQGARTIPTEDVPCLMASRYLQTYPVDSQKEFHEFLEYLERIRRTMISGASKGRMIITVICTSLEKLEALWEDCNTGHMDKVAQKFLITNDVIKEFGDVKITVTMLEEEYKACRAYFLLSGKP